MKMTQLFLTLFAALLGGALAQWLFQPGAVQAQDSDTLRGKRLEIVDDQGRVRARMSAAGGATEFELWGDDMTTNVAVRIKKDGAMAINLTDAKQKSRVVLGATADGWSGLAFADKEGRQRAGLGNDKDGAPTLSMNFANGKLASLLTVQGEKDSILVMNDPKGANMAAFGNSNGQPNLLLLDAKGNERMKLVLKEDSSPAMMLRDAGGKPRMVAGVNADGWAGFGVLDERETVRSLLFSERNGDNGLTIADKAGKSRAAVVVTDKDKPVVELLDENGNQLFKAPR